MIESTFWKRQLETEVIENALSFPKKTRSEQNGWIIWLPKYRFVRKSVRWADLCYSWRFGACSRWKILDGKLETSLFLPQLLIRFATERSCGRV